MPKSSAARRVAELANALGYDASPDSHGRVQFSVPSWCHSQDAKPSLSIGTHDSDGNASADEFPLLYCHAGCDYSLIRTALLAQGCRPDLLRGTGETSHPQQRSTSPRRRAAATVTYIADEFWLAWSDSLLDDHWDRVEFLEDRKHLSKATIQSLSLGWSDKHGRFTIPVFDESERCVNIRLYLPEAKPGDDKTISYSDRSGASYGRNRLYIPGQRLDRTRRTLLCAGEMDAILGWQHGWQTATVTAGETARFPRIDLDRMVGQQVYIAYDNDQAGRSGAERVAQDLASVAAKVWIVDVGSLGVDDKGDLGDVWRDPELGGEAIRQVVDGATRWRDAVDAEIGISPVHWSEFWERDPEPIRYLVDPLFAAGEVTRLFAQAKVGKSLLALETMAALATGREVLGTQPDPQSVIYIDQENTPDDWRDRLTSMGYSEADDLSRLHWYSLQSWPALDTKAGGQAVLGKVAEHGASIVVFDTQSKMLDGPEDKADTAGAFYRHTLLPLKREGCAVVIIDHAGNDPSKPRGTSGKRDDVDVVWQVAVRARDKLKLARTHSRKRHNRDHLYVNRLLHPTRHEIATEEERAEELLEACTAAILALDPRPDPTASGRAVIEALKAAKQQGKGKGWREATVQEAWKRLKGTLGTRDE